MELAEIIKALSEVGVLIICAAIVIWQVIKNTKQAEEEKKTFNEIIKTLKEQNDSMLDQILQKVDTGHLISAEEDKNIIKIEKELNKYLNEILYETNANRVAIFRYHNGGKDYNGRSFLRMSMTNEKVKYGTSLIQPQSQNLFRSMFFRLATSLDDNGQDYVEDIENIKETDPGFYAYLQNLDVRAKYSVGLYDSSSKMIGYLSLYYADNSNIDKDVIDNCLKEKKIKIETLLNL